MTSGESKKLYKNKHFYEIVKDKDHIKLYGPLDTIRFINPTDKAQVQIISVVKPTTPSNKYSFCEIIKGKITRAFDESEILVTDRIL